MTLISTSEFNEKLLGKTKLIDASWHLTNDKNGSEDYRKEHIEGAIFF